MRITEQELQGAIASAVQSAPKASIAERRRLSALDRAIGQSNPGDTVDSIIATAVKFERYLRDGGA